MRHVMLNDFFAKSLMRILRYIPKIKKMSMSDVSKMQSKYYDNFKHDVCLSDIIINAEILNKKTEETASRVLDKYGVVVLKGVVKNNVSLQAGDELKKYINECINSSNGINYYEKQKYIVQREPYVIPNYDAMMSCEKVLINIHGNLKDDSVDDGMVDLFGVDKFEGDFVSLKKSYEKFCSDSMAAIISKVENRSCKIKTSNAYYNCNISNTRGLHIDTPTREYKTFLYLTNVKTSEDGPYRYVPFSHRMKNIRLKNLLFNACRNGAPSVTTSNFCNEEHAIKFLGNAGDIIIADQRGIHAGTPQGNRHERLLLMSGYN